MSTDLIAAGIDVGGPRKGFHGVALGADILDQLHTRDPNEMVAWCLDRNVRHIAVDAPSAWREGRDMRQAECDLISAGIRCFTTPTRSKAVGHPTGWYDWILQGEALYHRLEKPFPLLNSPVPDPASRQCVETFPHAITHAYFGRGTRVKEKRTQRLEVLSQHGLSLPAGTAQDWIDAALCALTARAMLQAAQLMVFGDAASGYILTPSFSRGAP